MKKQSIFFCAVFCTLGVLACDGGVHYHVIVANERDIPVIVRAGTTESLLEQQLGPGKSLEFDLVDLNASLRAKYFVSVEPKAGPDVRSLYLSFARAEVKHNSETNPIALSVGSEQSEIRGVELLNIVDGVVIANDTVDELEVSGSVQLNVNSGRRIGAMLSQANSIELDIGNNTALRMHEDRNLSSSFGAPLGVRLGPEGTSVVVAYYFEEEWFRPDLIPAGVGDRQSPAHRNERTREVADILEKYFRENRNLPRPEKVTLPDFAIKGETYEWEEGCFLKTREQERDEWFHFRVYQIAGADKAYWLCRDVYLK
jgi:hypothetical protein